MTDIYTGTPSPAGTKGTQVPPTGTHPSPAQTHSDDDGGIFGVTPLSGAQVHTARALRHLYQSLCGGTPGQYWPQALLDSAGGLSRPSFPVGDRGGRK
jgi:hypothetical protein